MSKRSSSKSAPGPKGKDQPCPRSFTEAIARVRAGNDGGGETELAAQFAADTGEVAAILHKHLSRPARGGRISLPSSLLPPLP